MINLRNLTHVTHMHPTVGGLPCRLVLMVVPPGCPVDLPCDCQAPRAPCPNPALPSWGRRLAPSRKALPSLLCSYGLMRQAFTLLPISGFALIRKVFAGCCQPLLRKGPSQRYSADLSSDAWTPTAVADRVHLPVSSPVTSAVPK